MGASGRSMTCGDMKQFCKSEGCCGMPQKEVGFQVVPDPSVRLTGSNPCEGKKALTQPGLDNKECFKDAVRNAGEQSGSDVTQGYTGGIATDVTPISVPYFKTALCPVNVHWHLGAGGSPKLATATRARSMTRTNPA